MTKGIRPLSFRVYHWVNGGVLLLSVLTVVLRKTFLNSKKMGATIESGLSSKGIPVSEDLAKEIGRSIRDGMWEWHYRFGIVLAILLVYRLIFVKWPLPRFRDPRSVVHGAFYLALSFMAITGLTIYFSSSFGMGEALVDEIVEIHELGQWFFFAFLPIHLFGVIRAEMNGESGIVSRMIHGKE